jgi:hypothetical protein
LPRPQHWRLLDHDAGLVSAAVNELQTIPGVTAEAVIADLSALPEEALGRADIVTAAALLDLVSAAWLDELIASAVHYRLGMLFALTYTGDIRWQPRLDDDGCVREAFNAHQRGDKGFGAALGPDGAAAAAATAARYGCRVVRRPSPWRLGPRDSALQTQLLDGYKTAATEQVPERADAVADWAVARQARIRRGESRLWVGHEDVLALPP